MLNYETVGSSRLDEARAFYGALLEGIGLTKMFDPSGDRLYETFSKVAFGVLGAYNSGGTSVGDGMPSGFGSTVPMRSQHFTLTRLS